MCMSSELHYKIQDKNIFNWEKTFFKTIYIRVKSKQLPINNRGKKSKEDKASFPYNLILIISISVFLIKIYLMCIFFHICIKYVHLYAYFIIFMPIKVKLFNFFYLHYH